MDLVRAWLTALDPAAAPLAADLAALAGRDPYATRDGAGGLAAAEWSFRDGSPSVRFAWNIDERRVRCDDVATVLARWGALPAVLAALLPTLEGVHLQVGRDGPRVKLYVYARGAPPGTLDRVEAALGLAEAFAALPVAPGGAPPAFLGVDIGGPGGAGMAAKRYLELSREGAGGWLSELGGAGLAGRARALPDDLGSEPARFVVSVRVAADGLRDVALHAKLDRAPERLAELAGPALAAEASRRFRIAHRLGLVLRPTYVSWLQAGATTVGTVYHRLARRG